MDLIPIDAIYHIAKHLDLASSIRLASTCRNIYYSIIGEDNRRLTDMKKQYVDQIAKIEYWLEPVGESKLNDDYDSSDYDSDGDYEPTIDCNNDQISVRVIGDLIVAARYKTRPHVYGNWSPPICEPELRFVSNRKTNASQSTKLDNIKHCMNFDGTKIYFAWPRNRCDKMRKLALCRMTYAPKDNPENVDGILRIIKSKYTHYNCSSTMIYAYK